MNITHAQHTPFIYSAARPNVGVELTESPNAPLKPVEPVAASERSRLRTQENIDPEEKSASRPEFPEKDEREKAREERRSRDQLEQEKAEIGELAARDREVRAHEQAHVAVGGRYASGARYQYERGPNGVNYAVSGEVSIDLSKAATPEETIAKAQVIRRAALAPAEPSPQDLRVAAQATLMEAEARKELAVERVKEARANEQAGKAGEEVQRGDDSDVAAFNVEPDSPSEKFTGEVAPDSAGGATFSAPPVINSRLTDGIANTRPALPRLGNFLDQLA